MGLDAKLEHVVLLAGYSKPQFVAQSQPHTLRSQWSEIYHADSARAQKRVTVKVKTNGSVRERDAVADLASIVPNKTITTQYTAHELLHDDTHFLFLPREYLPDHLPLTELTELTKQDLIRLAIPLAEDLAVINDKQQCLGDIKPSNILARVHGRDPKFIDFDNATQFGQSLARYTDQFTHPDRTASAQADAYSLQQTILCLSAMHGFAHHDIFRTLANTEVQRAQDIIAVLDAPRQARRRTIGRLAGAAFIASAGFLERMREKHNDRVFAESENAALESFDGSEAAQRRLGIALAKKVGALTQSVYVPVDISHTVPVRFSIDGSVLYVNDWPPLASAALQLLATAAPHDGAILPSLRSYEHDFVKRIAQGELIYPRMTNLAVSPLLASWSITKNPQALEAILTVGDWFCKPEHHFRHPGGLIIPFRRDNFYHTARPILNGLDVRSGESLLAAAHAARLSGKDAAPYVQLLIEFCDSLSKAVSNNTIYEETDFSSRPTPQGEKQGLAHAMTASLFWDAGTFLEDTVLQQRSRTLIQPLVTAFPRVFVDTGNQDSYTAAIAYELLRKQQRTDSTVLLSRLVEKVPTGVFTKSFVTHIERTRKESIGGVCMPPKEEDSSWINVGTPAADAAFLSGLLYR